MWKAVLVGTAALAVVGSSIVYAQQRGNAPERQHRQFSQEDRAAFAAARIAALKAGLVMTAEQQKHWPAFEAALKDLARFRLDRMQARRSANEDDTDPTARLRRRAETLSGYGAALKKLADAQEPLYSSLDEAQKRRFAVLAQPHHHGFGAHHRHHHGHADRMRGERHGAGGMQRRGDLDHGWRDAGDWRGHMRHGFGGWRGMHRSGSETGDTPEQLPAPSTSGEGGSL